MWYRLEGWGDERQHGSPDIESAPDEQLYRIIKVCRVTDVVLQRVEPFLSLEMSAEFIGPSLHPTPISDDRVNLAIVRYEPEWLS